jgi:hypothetical protein
VAETTATTDTTKNEATFEEKRLIVPRFAPGGASAPRDSRT